LNFKNFKNFQGHVTVIELSDLGALEVNQSAVVYQISSKSDNFSLRADVPHLDFFGSNNGFFGKPTGLHIGRQ